MDIFEWIFKKRSKEKHIPEVESLKRSIKPEINLFDRFWQKHKEKRAVLRGIKDGKVSLLRKIPQLNTDILRYFRDILNTDNFYQALIKKIIYETTAGLHEVESWVRRYGDEKPPTWEQEYGQVVGPKGIRRPYYTEQAKRAILEKVKDEEKLEGFIRELGVEIREEFEALKGLHVKLEEVLNKQSQEAEHAKTIDFEEFTKEEDKILLSIRHILMDILNKILLFARKATLLEFDEQRIVKPIDAPKIGSRKIGVMLVHGMLGGPQGFAEFESYLQSKGFITYNVRLPGHVQTIDEFLSTPIAEIESFLISAFKYFYQYMAGVNVGDGRFFVIGHSLGAMMPLHIMAKSWDKKFPYQGMVKGMVSISAVLIPGDAKIFTKLGLPGILLTHFVIGKIMPFYMRGRSLIGKKDYKEVVNKIEEKVRQVRARTASGNLNPNQFNDVLKQELKPLLISRIREIKTRLTPSDIEVFFGKNEDNLVEEMIQLILENINKGKISISFGGELDVRALINQSSYQINFPFRHLTFLARLMYQLRNDFKKIEIPILILQGLHDTIAHPGSATEIYNLIRTPKKFKKLVMLQNSAHVPMIDFDKGKVFEESARFITEVDEGYRKIEEEQRRLSK